MGKIFQHNDPVTPCVPTNTTTTATAIIVAIVAHGCRVLPLHPYFTSLPRLLCPCQMMMILIMMNLASCRLLFYVLFLFFVIVAIVDCEWINERELIINFFIMTFFVCDPPYLKGSALNMFLFL